jgi:hypothetical protein
VNNQFQFKPGKEERARGEGKGSGVNRGAEVSINM